MQIEVDMSGRIEETNRPTVLALANGLSFSIRITAREKRLAIARLEQQKPELSRRLIHVLLFSNLLFLLLKDHMGKLDLVEIDPEYQGYEFGHQKSCANLVQATWPFSIQRSDLV
jgi:hypothetical protein